jgi:hypothetical protein
MKIIDTDHPFYRPLWRRLLLVGVCAAWTGVEYLQRRADVGHDLPRRHRLCLCQPDPVLQALRSGRKATGRATKELELFCFSSNHENALDLCFYAIPGAKPLRTFAGIALTRQPQTLLDIDPPDRLVDQHIGDLHAQRRVITQVRRYAVRVVFAGKTAAAGEQVVYTFLAIARRGLPPPLPARCAGDAAAARAVMAPALMAREQALHRDRDKRLPPASRRRRLRPFPDRQSRRSARGFLPSLLPQALRLPPPVAPRPSAVPARIQKRSCRTSKISSALRKHPAALQDQIIEQFGARRQRPAFDGNEAVRA